MKIGFYDSGLGGVKTLKDIIDMGLEGDIYYLADIKNNPYGTKSEEEVKEFARENVKKLVDLGCEIVIIACNTVTSVASKDLRSEFGNIKIIGTEPAVRLALKDNLNKKVLVLATTITINGERLKNLIKSLNADSKVELIATDKLVKLIEDGNFTNNQEEVNTYLKQVLEKYDLNEFSHIVLGCTHFPIVKDNIEKIVGPYNIKVIDGNEGIGRNIFRKLEENKEENENKNNKLSVKIMSTTKSEVFEKRVHEILNDVSYDLEE